jgi:diadenosine tetraphosphate (Ap4A) HIT family hydrolase
MECLTCQSLSGEYPLSPGPRIHDGQFWAVEHAWPTAVRGWLVIILKRHAEALHELDQWELLELASLQGIISALVFERLRCEKEYLSCFAEGDGFKHVHVHIIPKPKALSPLLKGPKIFELLGAGVPGVLHRDVVIDTSRELQRDFGHYERRWHDRNDGNRRPVWTDPGTCQPRTG